MAIAHADISAVEQVRHTAERQQEEVHAVSYQLLTLQAQIDEQVAVAKAQADSVIFRADEAMRVVRRKADELRSVLSDLQAQLSGTPPTITVTYCDDEGNSYSEEVPNPAYQALLGEISVYEARLSEVESVLFRFEDLQRDAYGQKQILAGAQSSAHSAIEAANISSRELHTAIERANEKLSKILSVLKEYLELRIFAPRLTQIQSEFDGTGGGGTWYSPPSSYPLPPSGTAYSSAPSALRRAMNQNKTSEALPETAGLGALVSLLDAAGKGVNGGEVVSYAVKNNLCIAGAHSLRSSAYLGELAQVAARFGLPLRTLSAGEAAGLLEGGHGALAVLRTKKGEAVFALTGSGVISPIGEGEDIKPNPLSGAEGNVLVTLYPLAGER